MGCVELHLLERDQTDYAPRPMRPSNIDIFCLIWAILYHVVDLFTDVNAAIFYYRNDEFYFFIATVVIVCIPSIVTSCVSYRMYTMDKGKEISYEWNKKMSFRAVMLILQLAPVLRYIDSLIYACKSRKAERRKNTEEQERYYLLMLKEDADVALLRVFECFLEAAPQQILQISFLLKHGSTIQPILSVGSSFVGMALCLMTYQRNIRYVQEDKDNIGFWGSIFIFLWHLLVTISRILMLSTLVFIAWNWALLSMCIHWIVMTVSLAILESHDFCSSSSSIKFQHSRVHESIANFLFSAVLGLVYIFTYITPGEGGTFYRYLFFYLICLLENISGATVWCLYGSKVWFADIMTAMCVAPFVIGCVFMIIYHSSFHPKHYIPPSVLPRRSQKKVSDVPHLPETPPPEISESSSKKNGFVSCEMGQGEIKKPGEESCSHEKL